MTSPADALTHGFAIHTQGQAAAARFLYRRVLERDPANADALHLCGMAERRLGNHVQALTLLRTALAVLPSHEVTAGNLRGAVVEAFNAAVAAHKQGAAGTARALYRAVLRASPDAAPARKNLSLLNAVDVALGQTLPDPRDQAAVAQRVLENDSEQAQALVLLGGAELRLGRADAAVARLRQAVRSAPDEVRPHRLLAEAFIRTGRSEAAGAALRRAVALSPAAPGGLADLARHLGGVGTPQGAFLLRWAARVAPLEPGDPLPCPAPVAGSSGGLRVGYLGPGGSALFAAVRRHGQCASSLYQYGGIPSPAPEADLTGVSPLDAALRIRADGVDVLVVSADVRTPWVSTLLSLGPAPFRVATPEAVARGGTEAVDAVLADPILFPPGNGILPKGRLLRLPETCRFLDPVKPSLLPEGGPLVLACPSPPSAIQPRVFAGILRAVAAAAGAVLWLAPAGLLAESRLRAEAAALRVPPERIVFHPILAEPPAAWLGAISLLLDAAPGEAPVDEALRYGVPALTFPGSTFAGSLAAGLTRAAGLPDLAAASPDGFVDTLLRLTLHRNALEDVRGHLRAAGGAVPLFDASRFVRTLEQALAVFAGRPAVTSEALP